MKKILMTVVSGAFIALALNSCNNAEEVKKQVDEQDAKIQSLIDEKLNGLQAEADQACATLVEDSARAAYTVWSETEGKKKGAVKPKPKPKPAPVKEEPKKEEPKTGSVKEGLEKNNTSIKEKLEQKQEGGSIRDRLKNKTKNP